VGFFNAVRLTNPEPAMRDLEVKAAAGFTRELENLYSFPGQLPNLRYATREQAMTVPAIARSRNILAGSIGTIPLESYNKLTGAHVNNRTLIVQPDPALPRVNTITWLVDDLIFYGVGYLQVLDVSPEDGRPFRARRIDPRRVQATIDSSGTLITGYQVDSKNVPSSGLSSLIVFNAIDEGVLARGGMTISSAIALEQAAYNMASEPVPQMVLLNEGMNLPSDQVSAVMDTFRRARRERSTAYIEGPIKLEVVGMDSAQMQLVEARQHLSSEIARLMGIPAWYLNAENASATYSNVASERRSLVDFGLRNYLTIIEDRLSMDDVTPRNQVVRFDLDDFLRGNAAERVDMSIKLYDSGIITRDEAREFIDISPAGSEESNDNGVTPRSQTRETPFL
jgi:HK97 family phage portal protein